MCKGHSVYIIHIHNVMWLPVGGDLVLGVLLGGGLGLGIPR